MSSSLGLFEGVRFAWKIVGPYTSDEDKTVYLQSDAGEASFNQIPAYVRYKQGLQNSFQKQAEKAHKNAIISAVAGGVFVILGLLIIGSGGIGAMIFGGIATIVGGASIVAARDVCELFKNLNMVALHPNRFCVIVKDEMKCDRRKLIAALQTGLIFMKDNVPCMIQ